jgi:hypothetical protein
MKYPDLPKQWDDADVLWWNCYEACNDIYGGNLEAFRDALVEIAIAGGEQATSEDVENMGAIAFCRAMIIEEITTLEHIQTVSALLKR